MNAGLDQVVVALPALLFLCAGVPLAVLLDELGLFTAWAASLQRAGSTISVGALWALAAVTTAVLNLDTTIVLLTPLFIRLGRRCGYDTFRLALVPLFLASFASSMLPVSNLTTLIAVERLDLSAGDVIGTLALPSIAACVAGWLVFRRTLPAPAIVVSTAASVDRRSLTVGTGVVVALLVGFVLGPSIGVDAWVVVVAADVVLMAITRRVPWRQVPIGTALGVAAVVFAVAATVPSTVANSVQGVESPAGSAAVVVAGAATANAINNIPATLIVTDCVDEATWGVWAWLLGANTGAVLLPLGALANVLWWRIMRVEGVPLSLRSYLAATWWVGSAALTAAAATLALTVWIR